MEKIEITLEQLRELLIEQRSLTIEKLLYNSSSYNNESTIGDYVSLPINEDEFKKIGNSTSFPNDFIILSKYMKK